MLVSIQCQMLLNDMLCKYGVDDAEALNASQVHSLLVSCKIFDSERFVFNPFCSVCQ